MHLRLTEPVDELVHYISSTTWAEYPREAHLKLGEDGYLHDRLACGALLLMVEFSVAIAVACFAAFLHLRHQSAIMVRRLGRRLYL